MARPFRLQPVWDDRGACISFAMIGGILRDNLDVFARAIVIGTSGIATIEK
jgi:hypothetical protein